MLEDIFGDIACVFLKLSRIWKLSPHCVDNLERMSFCFIFKKGEWIEKEYDTFEIMSHYDELAFGDFDKF